MNQVKYVPLSQSQEQQAQLKINHDTDNRYEAFFIRINIK